MSDEEKILKLFEMVHGWQGEKDECTTAVIYSCESGRVCGVDVVKHGTLSWSASLEELLFDCLTEDML